MILVSMVCCFSTTWFSSMSSSGELRSAKALQRIRGQPKTNLLEDSHGAVQFEGLLAAALFSLAFPITLVITDRFVHNTRMS